MENPSKFTFNVVWTSMEEYETARGLDAFARFRAAFGEMGISGTMSHYLMGEAIPGASA